jgi:hypothetical protein
MPCIEVWFIMHYVRPQYLYNNSHDVVSDLQKRCILEYKKNQQWQEKNLYPQLNKFQEKAFANVIDFVVTNHTDQKTATSIQKLVKLFLDNYQLRGWNG